jgi:CCR4-NOT transcription complex subunit 2
MFHSPWQDLSGQQTIRDFDPKYDLPACYRMPATPSAQSKITKFSDETLFYIFYAMPQDVLQDAAAYELTRRNWRYHKGIQMWLTKTENSVSRPGESFEEGEFIFWDVNMWQKTKVLSPPDKQALNSRTDVCSKNSFWRTICWNISMCR